MLTVYVQYHYEPESWWADSPDIPGFTAAGGSFEEVREQARKGIRFFMDEPVVIVEQGVALDVEMNQAAVIAVLKGAFTYSSTYSGGVPTSPPAAAREVHTDDVRLEGALEDDLRLSVA